MADEYIRKQDAIDALDRIFDNVPMELTTEILRLRRELRGLSPAEDVVPVVRCKQCGWSMESREVPGMYMCKNDDAVDNYVRPEFACILAERREG